MGVAYENTTLSHGSNLEDRLSNYSVVWGSLLKIHGDEGREVREH